MSCSNRAKDLGTNNTFRVRVKVPSSGRTYPLPQGCCTVLVIMKENQSVFFFFLLNVEISFHYYSHCTMSLSQVLC